MGSFAFGNFVKESGCLDRLSKTMQNELMNLATILLGLGVGMQMSADKFMNLETLESCCSAWSPSRSVPLAGCSSPS